MTPKQGWRAPVWQGMTPKKQGFVCWEVRPGVTSVTVRQVMAHHASMSLLSIAYVLVDKPMQRRFESDPMLRSVDLLLHERIPRAAVPVYPHVTEANATSSASAEEAGTMRVLPILAAEYPMCICFRTDNITSLFRARVAVTVDWAILL